MKFTVQHTSAPLLTRGSQKSAFFAANINALWGIAADATEQGQVAKIPTDELLVEAAANAEAAGFKAWIDEPATCVEKLVSALNTEKRGGERLKAVVKDEYVLLAIADVKPRK